MYQGEILDLHLLLIKVHFIALDCIQCLNFSTRNEQVWESHMLIDVYIVNLRYRIVIKSVKL